jgi:predicted nucleic acid-binding protein
MKAYMLSLFKKVVLDSNVILQGLKNKKGASGFILEKIRTLNLEMMISISVYD